MPATCRARRPYAALALAAAAATAALAGPARGQSTWNSATDGNWSDAAKWTPNGVPDGGSVIVNFNGQDWTGQTITVDSPEGGSFRVGQLIAADSTGGGGLILSGGVLTLDNGASRPIIQTNNNFSEPAGSSPFNNPLRITSVLAGTNGFEKTGPGYLSLEAANTFTGNVVLTAPASGGGSFLRLTNDNNLGATDNDIVVNTGAQAVGLFASTGFTVTLNPSRNVITTGTGDFWVKTKGSGNIIFDGVISGTARFRKNDSGLTTLRGANTFSGNTILDGGTLRLENGNNRLPSGSTVTFSSASTLDLTNTSQTLNGLGLLGAGQTNTISGAGGTLILQGSGDYTVNTTVTGTSLDMAGLSDFTFNRPSNSLQLNANGTNVVNTINLARVGTNTINATNVRFGGGANATGQDVLIGLGQSNLINASAEFLVAYFQGNGNVSFQSGLTNPSLTVRGAGGGSTPVPLMTVGSTNSGNRSSTGILNLTGGSLDVIATELNVARHFANAGGTSATGTLTMPAGTVVTGTLNLAVKTNTTGAPTLTGTFNQSGGTVTATSVFLGNNANAEAPNLIATYNLSNGGTLFAASIDGAGTTFGTNTNRTLNVNGGIIRNVSSSDLTIDGVNATAQGVVKLVMGANGGTFNADPGRTITITPLAPISGAGGLTKAGLGTLTLTGTNTYAGTTTVQAGTLRIGTGGALQSSSAITVKPNAVLEGVGSVGSGLTTVETGGTIAPGNGGTGVLTLSGGLTLDGTYDAEINFANDLAVAPSADQIVVSAGTTDLNGGTIRLTLLNAPLGTLATPQTVVLVKNADGVVATNTGVTWLPASASPFVYDILETYNAETGFDTGGNDLAIRISAVPEPGTLSLLALGGLAMLRRRRSA